MKEVVRSWRKKNTAKLFEYYLRDNYGMTVADYWTAWIRQGGECGSCSTPLEPSGILVSEKRGKDPNVANVDHNHVTGKFRGLLCSKCNLGLGNFDDDVAKLRLAIQYLEETNA